jgi:hypothetical protein
MPYITQEKRKVYNSYIKLVKNSHRLDPDEIEELVTIFRNEAIEDREGAVNYFITQLIRCTDLHSKVMDQIVTVLEMLYVHSPRYFKFKNLFGLIDSIAKELIRREWDTIENMAFLEALDDEYTKLYGEYEDKCIVKNGDLEDV